jgi:hypothetical protein
VLYLLINNFPRNFNEIMKFRVKKNINNVKYYEIVNDIFKLNETVLIFTKIIEINDIIKL